MPAMILTKWRGTIQTIPRILTTIAAAAGRAARFAAKYRKYRRLGNIHIVAWRLARDQQ